jgi:hypothetical protein
MSWEIQLFYWIGWFVLSAILLILGLGLFYFFLVLFKGHRIFFPYGTLLGWSEWDDKQSERFRKFLKDWKKQEQEVKQ